MLTVLYDDDMPTADELEQLAASLDEGRSLDSTEAGRVARVLREVSASLKRTVIAERVSDEGFD